MDTLTSLTTTAILFLLTQHCPNFLHSCAFNVFKNRNQFSVDKFGFYIANPEVQIRIGTEGGLVLPMASHTICEIKFKSGSNVLLKTHIYLVQILSWKCYLKYVMIKHISTNMNGWQVKTLKQWGDCPIDQIGQSPNYLHLFVLKPWHQILISNMLSKMICKNVILKNVQNCAKSTALRC